MHARERVRAPERERREREERERRERGEREKERKRGERERREVRERERREEREREREGGREGWREREREMRTLRALYQIHREAAPLTTSPSTPSSRHSPPRSLYIFVDDVAVAVGL